MFNPPIKPQETIILSCTQETVANPTIVQIQEACAKIRQEYPDVLDSEISIDATSNFDWVVEVVSVNFYREIPNPKYNELMSQYNLDMIRHNEAVDRLSKLIKEQSKLNQSEVLKKLGNNV